MGCLLGDEGSTGTATFEIALAIGGNVFGAVFLAGLVIAQFTSGVAAQASAARLLYVMGRDGALPRRIFGQLSKRFHSPFTNVIIIGVVGFIALFLDVATSTSFINFGAFLAFTMVNLSVIAYAIRQRKAGNHVNVFGYIIVPIVGAAITFYLLTRLDMTAIMLGLSWLAIGVIVLAIVTRGFKQLPPELAIDEAEPEQVVAAS